MNALIKVAALAAVLSVSSAFAQNYPAPEPSAKSSEKSADYSKLDVNGDGSISKDEAKKDPTPFSQVQRTRHGQEWFPDHGRVERRNEQETSNNQSSAGSGAVQVTARPDSFQMISK